MFDCPEPTHTSPTSTSAMVIVLAPVMVISAAGPGVSGCSQTSQRPSGSVTVSSGLAAKRDRDGFPGRRLAEDADRHVALEQHVIADDARQLDVGKRTAGEREEGDQEGRGCLSHDGSGVKICPVLRILNNDLRSQSPSGRCRPA